MPPPLPVWCLPELRLSPPLDALGESCLKSGLTLTTSSFEEEDSCSRFCFDSDCVAQQHSKGWCQGGMVIPSSQLLEVIYEGGL